MFIRQILADKSREIVSAHPEDDALEAATLMKTKRVGAVVVLDPTSHLIGIISERDIACGFAEHGPGLMHKRIGDLMTADVITCAPDDSVDQVMRQMTAGRFRHLPVMEAGEMLGMISIGDVVKYRLKQVEAEASLMQDYIAGAA